MPTAYIYDAIRTPRGVGDPSGALYEVKPISLLAKTIRAIGERNGLAPERVDDLILGCATPTADQGFNIARSGLLRAGWDGARGGLQINRFCTSGLEAINLAAARIAAGFDELILAGGLESMSRVPMGSDGGPLMYDPQTIVRSHFIPQGVAADLIATLHGYSREQLDEYALRSYERATAALKAGRAENNLIPIRDGNDLLILGADETVRTGVDAEALAGLAPAFAETGRDGFDRMALHRYPTVERIEHVHTAGNSCGLADGASLALIGGEEVGKLLDRPPRAAIRAVGMATVDATIMLTGGPEAARKALKKAGLEPKDIDLWEYNETFAAAAVHFQETLDIPADRLNVNGGAIAHGHPLGAAGSMLLTTLLEELEQRDGRYGLVTLSAGTGIAVATLLERTTNAA